MVSLSNGAALDGVAVMKTTPALPPHANLSLDHASPVAVGTSVVYALVDPRTDEVRYVGKADNLRKRVTAHLHDHANTRKARWIGSLRTVGLQPRVVVLEEVEPGRWQDAERRWIAHFRSNGCDLTNHTDGGEGLCNASAETREKLRQLRLAEWADPERQQALLSIIRSPIRRSRISARLTGLRKTPEHIAKLPQMRAGRKLSPEHAEKMRQHLRSKGYKWPKGVSPSEATRNKISEALRGNQHTRGRVMAEAERVLRSMSLKGRPKTAETRENMRLAALGHWEKRRKEVNDDTGIQEDSDAAYAAE